MKRTAKRFVLFPVILLLFSFLLTSLTGCFDLGMFKDGEEEGYADYYAAFGTITAFYKDGTSVGEETFDLKESLFNSSTVNDQKWEPGTKSVEERPYLLLAMRVSTAMEVDSVSLFFSSSVNDDIEELRIYGFLYEGSLDDISASLETYLAGEELEDGDYDVNSEMTPDTAICTDTVTPTSSWNSAQLRFNRKQESGWGDYIIFYFYNNTPRGQNENFPEVSFNFMNLLVRAFEPED